MKHVKVENGEWAMVRCEREEFKSWKIDYLYLEIYISGSFVHPVNLSILLASDSLLDPQLTSSFIEVERTLLR